MDVGTTGCKAVAFREDGRLLAQAYREYPLLNPEPGFYELDPDLVWENLRDCIREVNGQVADDPVSALGIAAQGEAVIPVNRNGDVLANSPVSSDSRAVQQVAQLEERLGFDQIYEITGQPPSTLYSLPKIMWWQEQNEVLFRETWKFLCYGDFVALRLGLQPVIDHSMAARTMGFDIRKQDWSDVILEAAGVDKEQLPVALPSGTVIGEIPSAIASDLGFIRGVQLVTGGHDQPCAALGAGVVQPGEVLYSIGTTEAIATITDRLNTDLKRHNIPCYPYVLPEMFITLSGNQTGGRLLRWYRDELGAAEREIASHSMQDVYDVIVDQIDDAPSNLLILPYFAGSGSLHNNPLARGAIIGLSFDTQRKDIVKAILEGITYEQALGLEYLRDMGIVPKRLRAVGGGSRSDTWLQIKADIIGIPISTVHVHETASYGAAMLAGWATSMYSDLSQTLQEVAKPQKTFYPRSEFATYYRTQLAQYAELYTVLQPFTNAQ